MSKTEILRESAKVLEKLSDDVLDLIKDLNEEKVVTFDNMGQYEQFQVLVKEGYLEKSYRKYSKTEKCDQLLETQELMVKDQKKFEKMIQEEDTSKEYITVSYKVHDFENDKICNETAKFEVETDGIPVVQVDEEVYANLIHREEGQHWKKYLGEDGRQLIRQKKIKRFYVESEKTGRRYLYIV
jgi:hypothetical protein